MNINPLPPQQGIGFTSLEEIPEAKIAGYRHEQIGRYHNYHMTKENWKWPKVSSDPKGSIDGFSPNLNKVLHVGHIRNLTLASSLCKIAGLAPVAMLGASLGVKQKALDSLRKWLEIADYPLQTIEYDVLLPDDFMDDEFEPGKDKAEGCKVWQGPEGYVIVEKSDGKKTYSYHDLVFSRTVSPEHYITGAEQKEHFKRLGLDDKHFGMGLVVGRDGKLSSRDGGALSADDAEMMVINNLKDTEHKGKLAWNIMTWNFLSVSRKKNVQFDPENWTKSESPGMYISYTYARMMSAIKKASEHMDNGGHMHIHQVNHEELLFKSNNLTEEQIAFLGFLSYFEHYKNICARDMDTCKLAKYTHNVAKKLTAMYNKHKIMGADETTTSLFIHAARRLKVCMNHLNMYAIEEI